MKDWRNTGNDVPLALVRAAILAASPRNTQPWLFKITDSSIELHIDTQRNVGALDPYLRVANLRSFRWQPHCRGLYQTPVAA